ncbi:hypothetical protein D3C86_1205540 [compost metagenome]
MPLGAELELGGRVGALLGHLAKIEGGARAEIGLLGHLEVGELHGAAREQDVLRPDVTVHDPTPVSVGEGVSAGDRHIQRALDGQDAQRKGLAQILGAFDPLAHDVIAIILRDELLDAGDRRMEQLHGQLGLAQQLGSHAVQVLGPLEGVVGHLPDGHQAVLEGIEGEVGGVIALPPEQRGQAVLVDHPGRHRRAQQIGGLSGPGRGAPPQGVLEPAHELREGQDRLLGVSFALGAIRHDHGRHERGGRRPIGAQMLEQGVSLAAQVRKRVGARLGAARGVVQNPRGRRLGNGQAPMPMAILDQRGSAGPQHDHVQVVGVARPEHAAQEQVRQDDVGVPQRQEGRDDGRLAPFGEFAMGA